MKRYVNARTWLPLAVFGWGVLGAAGRELWQPYYVFPRSAARHLDLSRDWQLSSSREGGWFDVAEPTSVQMALHKAGKLPHPYVHLNSSLYADVDEKPWYYRKRFRAARPDGYAFLYFQGIDYFARIWLNGALLGDHEGMFGGPAIEVSKYLRDDNELIVEVRAGNWGRKKTYRPRDPGPIIKPWVIAGGTGGEMFFPLGMWQGARLEYVPRFHLERPYLTTRRASAARAALHLSVEVLNESHSLEHSLHPAGNTQMRYYAEWWKLKPREATIEFTLTGKRSGRVALRRLLAVKALDKRNWVEADIEVPAPQLWWPNGLGEPALYVARVALKDGPRTLDAIEFEYGIRALGMEMTPGPRLQDRWAPWQFVVNGRKFFAKGINWMPADILLDLPRERYHWLLSAARNAGVQIVRIWGGGLIEPEAFYSAANELGILVWQDFPIGNMFTPLYPQAVWESQVLHTIFRLRNHPSLALWCGGNEFNPYAEGNAATIGILERSLADFDPSRPFRRTSPDHGSLHDYPDMDPSWYARKFPFLPYMSETGMHNIPNAKTMREVVSAEELKQPLSRMFDKDFPARFPDFRHHFVEYEPVRVPRMLSRASHVADISSPSIDALAEATQIGAGEFYQVLSEALQSNYPVTAGLMPWVFKRPWPVVAIQTMDGFGHPTAPYYFLKRTYEPVHVLWKAGHLLWAPGETVPVVAAALNALAAPAAATVGVEVLDDRFARLWSARRAIAIKTGPSVSEAKLGEWKIPSAYADRYFFVLVEMRNAAGKLVSRQVYWPRSLRMLADAATLAVFRQAPKEWPALEKGPWLKPAVAANRTSLRARGVRKEALANGRTKIAVTVANAGKHPAFPVLLEFDGARHSAFGSDNFFWLAAGEERTLEFEILPREKSAVSWLTASALNAPAVEADLP